MKKKDLKIILTIGSLIAPFFISFLAFSDKSRDKIKERAKYKSEITGRRDLPMECMHINHDKSKGKYNDPKNGIYGTVIEHFLHHYIYQGQAHLIGLTETENDWAVQACHQRVLQASNRKGWGNEELLLRVQEDLEITQKFYEKIYNVEA